LRALKAELQMSNQEVDHRAGFTEDHTNKILGPRRNKKFGRVSLPDMFGALGVRLFLLEDTVATARTLSRITPRKAAHDNSQKQIASANG
jgi:hypothetical protein